MGHSSRQRGLSFQRANAVKISGRLSEFGDTTKVNAVHEI